MSDGCENLTGMKPWENKPEKLFESVNFVAGMGETLMNMASRRVDSSLYSVESLTRLDQAAELLERAARSYREFTSDLRARNIGMKDVKMEFGGRYWVKDDEAGGGQER